MYSFAVISDIHGNLTALDAVLEHMSDNYAISRLACLGDIVGYGPRPLECIERVFSVCTDLIKGNHDEAVSKATIPDDFNETARKSTKIQISMLESRLDYKKKLFKLEIVRGFFHKDKKFSLIHGGPSYPLNEYVYPSPREFDELLPFMELTELDLLLLGHTHVPFTFFKDDRMILNPGSIGQPRDGDPRASYAVIDIDSMEAKIERVDYDIDQVISDMDNLGLPQNLMRRLKKGK